MSGRDFWDHVVEPTIRLARVGLWDGGIALVTHGCRHRRYADLAVTDLEILGLAADGPGGGGRMGRFHFSLRRNCSAFSECSGFFLGRWRTALRWRGSTAEMRGKSCSIVTISSQFGAHTAAVPCRPWSNRQRLVN